MQSLSEKAIQAALKGKGEEAVELNHQILKEDPRDLDSLNRLARAFTELGETGRAFDTYKQVLTLDKYNPIATKNLKRLKAKRPQTAENRIIKSPPIYANFLEEPGKTKTAQLVRLADADILAELKIGQSLMFDAKRRLIAVKAPEDVYIGSLPDDLSYRLRKFIHGGNRYDVFVKGLEGSNVQVFIRETQKSTRFKNIPSFPPTSHTMYYADINPSVFQEEPVDIRETGEGIDES